ncbi:hypothetical protein QBC46DRAFT_366819 [Diplogelasinospora grovesii]|uniref:Uncharacterized protein n=1 Tax=Diplogelasinospora grovesii TaxID=303347 RepID=A0AAN6N1R1_9PEZI|nr:hypothetical protein QBC46DRAFT_366819 [Diplogelasinospora grovesii]
MSPNTPTSSLVTLIITTSPTPSAPSTELLSAIILSFRKHCPALVECPVVVVLDTYDRIAPQARLKKGQVTPEGAANFELYKQNAKDLVVQEYCCAAARSGGPAAVELRVSEGEAEYGSGAYLREQTNIPLTITRAEDGRVTFIEPQQRLGFGLAVRSALRLTQTPYVWVQQHDWTLVTDIPLGPLLDVMQDSEPAPESDDQKHPERPPVKYVCFPSVRNLSYATSDHVRPFPVLKSLTSELKREFHSPARPPDTSIPLTPLFFWHDKPHVASTAHYLSQVFPSRKAMLRGAFIEDTVGQRARTEMKEGGYESWSEWATWLYYPGGGKQMSLRHLKGRTWRGTEAELEQKLEWMRLNQEAAPSGASKRTPDEVLEVSS